MTGPGAAGWRVDAERQAAFVALSGDRNPLHVDPVAARRLPFGRVAVHGLHLLLETVDRIVADTEASPHRIRCTFRHPVGVDDDLRASVDASDPDDVRVSVGVDVWTAADVRVEVGDPLPELAIDPATPEPGEPEVLAFDDLAGRSGAIAVAADEAVARRLFPHLAERIGSWRLAELVSLTRLVGMHVPGLHSMLSRLDVRLGAGTGRPGDLQYTVTKADDRFSQVTIEVTGPTVAGTLVAFVRPAPVEQELGDVRPELDEFAGERWLVIGGSRGLGAASVRLLDAGGADVRFTYRTGVEDAAAIAARTARATAHRLDVLDPDAAIGEITADGWQPTHLAYMATPPIFDGVGGTYSDALHARFVSVYVDAFVRLVEVLPPLIGILWPSSEAAGHDVAGLAEYADAKRAGEEACHRLADADPGLTVHAPRLPRLLTDQSTSFVPTEFGDTAVELLRALRGLH